MIRTNEETMPVHVRKYNVTEASGVAALIFAESHGKLNIVLIRRSEYGANGFDKLDLIN